MQILELKKRNWLQRLISTEHWIVRVKHEGVIYDLVCWAGFEFDDKLLIHDIIKKIDQLHDMG